MLGWAGRLPRKPKLQFAALAVVVLTLLSFFVWGDNRGPFHTIDSTVAGETLLGADDRTITLTADWGPCNYRPDLVARESADHVALLLRQKDFSGPGVGCDGDGGTARISTKLDTALGDRPIVDAVTGKSVQIFPAQNLAEPDYLPSRYQEDTKPNRYMYGLVKAQDASPQYTRAFRNGSNGGPAPLLITQTIGSGGATAGTDQIDVHGHPASFSNSQSGSANTVRTLSWFDGKYQYSVSTTSPNQLSDQELSRIANGLVAPG
ncbi:hypothetical protein GCM10009665_65810 [Kitasatospora nipponensis]|uniref:Secreted protein n=1 Tax=Kitasatospora nipponensis TaxID=258049 RepID=A0ABN3INN3_9ACTN